MFGFGKNKKDKKPASAAAQVDADVQEPTKQPEQDVKQGIKTDEELSENQSKKSWLGKLKTGLSKSSSKLNDGIKDIFIRKKLDDETLEELEDLLITSDLGVQTAALVTANLAKNKFDKEITAQEIKAELSACVEDILKDVATPLQISADNKPHVILMCGVNGTGKTTTIGKIANNLHNEGKKVMLAACDTFRAAAVEQLEVWSQRANCPIVKGDEGTEPASLAYQAYEKARDENYDVLIIDTAGRLQNKKNLMEQLSKIVKVINKLDDSSPHDCIIVLDATTGQNANSQVKVFKEMVNLSGIIVTKLDGTAKGGVVVSLAKQFGLPIHAIGVGEGIDDLRSFEAKSFADSLVG